MGIFNGLCKPADVARVQGRETSTLHLAERQVASTLVVL
jgi:hypothetical protein